MKLFGKTVLCLSCTWDGEGSECEHWRVPGFGWDVKTLRCPKCGSSVASTASAARNYNRMLEGLAVSRRKNQVTLIRQGNPLGRHVKMAH